MFAVAALGCGRTELGADDSGAQSAAVGGSGSGGSGGSEPACGPSNENCSPLSLAFRGEDTQSILGLDAMGDGRFAIAGVTAGDVDMGAPSGQLSHVGNGDGFVASFDAQGQAVWSRLIGDAAPQELRRIAFDAAGELVATGVFSGSYDFGSGLVTANGEDALLVKFDATGNVRWAKLFGDSETQRGWDVAISAQGEIATVGSFGGSIDFGGGATTAVHTDAYVAKFDGDGRLLWDRTCTGEGTQQLWGVEVDASGNVLVTGTFHGAVQCGKGEPLVSNGGSDVFVAKYDANGQLLFQLGFGNASDEEVRAVVAADNGDFVVVGTLDGELTIGSETVSGDDDVLVAKFAASGAVLWAKRFGSEERDTVRHATLDRFGNILVSGWFQSTLDTPDPIMADGADGFVLKLDPDGNFVWSRQLGGEGSQDAVVLASDGLANVYVAGSFWYELGVDDPVPAYDAQADGFVVKLAP